MTSYRKGVNCIWALLVPILPAKLYLEDRQEQVLTLKHGRRRGIGVAAELSDVPAPLSARM